MNKWLSSKSYANHLKYEAGAGIEPRYEIPKMSSSSLDSSESSSSPPMRYELKDEALRSINSPSDQGSVGVVLSW